MSASPPSEYPNRRYSVATPASAMHENLFNICHETFQYSEELDNPDSSINTNTTHEPRDREKKEELARTQKKDGTQTHRNNTHIKGGKTRADTSTHNLPCT